GRAIELLEGFLFTGSQPEEEVLASLKHVGEALYNLYMATGKEKEAGILKERLAENHVAL
ncbi:hypothetical protein GUG52_10830, partial [Xanthomonas citri pv. citri]|nr:hypothetical protein [Xanthomonas citri pv. citri]